MRDQRQKVRRQSRPGESEGWLASLCGGNSSVDLARADVAPGAIARILDAEPQAMVVPGQRATARRVPAARRETRHTDVHPKLAWRKN